MSRCDGADRPRCPGDRSHARDSAPGRDARRADARTRDVLHARRRRLRGGRRSGRRLGSSLDRRPRRRRARCWSDPTTGCCHWRGRRWAAADAAVEITSDDVVLQPVSHTFHGRDVFAPAAAHLAEGDAARRARSVARRRAPPRRWSCPAPMVAAGAIGARVTGVDGFGNVQLNVGPRRPRGGRYRTGADRSADGRSRASASSPTFRRARSRRSSTRRGSSRWSSIGGALPRPWACPMGKTVVLE